MAGAGGGWSALIAFAGWYFQETLKQIFPTPRRLARWGRIWRGEVPRAKGTHFTVLIADLDGDADGTHTRHIVAALRNYTGLDVILVGRGPKTFDLGTRVEAQLEAEKRGRDILGKLNGDVLIFGEVAQANTRLRLRFLPGHEALEDRQGSYQLQAAELPAEFGSDFHAVLMALVAASIAPVTEQAGSYLVDLLRPAARKLENLLANPPPQLNSYQRGLLLCGLGLATLRLGQQTGEDAWFSRSLATCHDTLQVWTRARAPLQWAMTQNNLGSTLMALGYRERSGTCFKEAIAAYRSAAGVLTRQRSPLDWAGIQTNLASALSGLGELEKRTDHLNKAVKVFEKALKEGARERAPLQWAMTQNNLGSALRMLGRREDGTEHLEQAVAAFRAALEVRTRERVPLEWATTQNNLGAALLSLGEREHSLGDSVRFRSHLQEAVAVLRAALEIRTRRRLPFHWTKTMVNLASTLGALGQREGSCTMLEEAVRLFRDVLKKRTFDREPDQWADTQYKLGNALLLVGEHKQVPFKVVALYRMNFNEFTRAIAPHQRWLSFALLRLIGPIVIHCFEESVDAHRDALKV